VSPDVRERLLAAVAARLEAGDPEAILAEDARAELDQLLGFWPSPVTWTCMWRTWSEGPMWRVVSCSAPKGSRIG
jgi:DNA topoisomerase IA